MSRIAVVGAGIVGSMTARELRKSGHDVTLVDRQSPGHGCSYGNACLISPDAVVPFVMPASLRRAPGWLLNPVAPLSIRWTDLPATAPGLFRLMSAARPDRVLRAGRAMADLHRGSLDAYRRMLVEIGRPELLVARGQLQVSRDLDAFGPDHLSDTLRREAGAEVHRLDAPEIRDLVPALAADFRSGQFFPRNGHVLSSLGLVEAVVTDFLRRGGHLIKDDALLMLRNDVGVIDRLVLATGKPLQVEAIVLAAGFESSSFLRRHGIRVPLIAERGYHLSLAAPGIDLPLPVSNRDDGFAVTPVDNGIRIAGTVEFARPEAAPNWKRAENLGNQARRMFPGLVTEAAQRWTGVRPSMSDGIPRCGPCLQAPGVFLAFGNGHFGMTAAPGMAKRIAAALATESMG